MKADNYSLKETRKSKSNLIEHILSGLCLVSQLPRYVGLATMSSLMKNNTMDRRFTEFHRDMERYWKDFAPEDNGYMTENRFLLVWNTLEEALSKLQKGEAININDYIERFPEGQLYFREIGYFQQFYDSLDIR